MKRYSSILQKNKREIVLLKGMPCAWGKCTFCDYIEDNEKDVRSAVQQNRKILSHVTGEYGALEIINSGSVFELPPETLADLRALSVEKNLQRLYFECHWNYRYRLDEIRAYFQLPIIFKCGIETFNHTFRNQVLNKGIYFESPQEVARCFESICLMVCIQGQTKAMIQNDIEILLSCFRYGCVNVYQNNTTRMKRDDALASWFAREYAFLNHMQEIDVLFHNTDFGVGGE